MQFDVLGELCDAQAFVASAASENYIDQEVEFGHLGVGADVWLTIECGVAAPTANGDESVIIVLETDSVANFASPKTVFSITDRDGGAIVAADPEWTAYFTTPGSIVWSGSLPYTCDERYIQLYVTTGGTDESFTLDAYFTNGPPPTKRKGRQLYASPVGLP